MKRLGLVMFVVFISTNIRAQFRSSQRNQQDSNGSSLADKIYFAGGGNFGSGTNPNGLRYSYYSLFPTIGYRVKPDFMLGVNLSFTKYTFPDVIAPYRNSYTQFGYAPFTRYYIQQLFFQLEYDRINSTTLDVSQPTKTYERLLVGIGYRMQLGKRSAVNAMLLYDLLYQSAGPFLSPVVYRVFFSF